METHSLFNIHQHGFRSKHSCVTQLLEVIEDLMEKIDQGHEIDIAYLDLVKPLTKSLTKGYSISYRLITYQVQF